MATKANTSLDQQEVESTSNLGSSRLAGATVGVSVLQGLCVWFMAIGTLKLAFGLGVLGLAGTASFIHSDPVRIPLMLLATLGATATLFVIWNQQRLRNLPSAQWRKRPLTTREKRRMGIAVAASLFSYFLV